MELGLWPEPEISEPLNHQHQSFDIIINQILASSALFLYVSYFTFQQYMSGDRFYRWPLFFRGDHS